MIVKLKPTLTISDAQAMAIVERVAAGRSVARISEIQGGEISAIFQIDLAGGASPLVLKVYPDALHWKMRKELMVSQMMAGRLSVPTPRIVLSDDTKSLLDLNFVVMGRLDGVSLSEYERTATLGHTEVSSVYAQLGKVLREIHGIPMAAFGYIGADGVVTPHASNRAYMSFQFHNKLAEFVERGGSAALAGRLRTLVDHRAFLLDGCAAPSLCHYDFHAGNILVEEREGSPRLSGILDLENAIAGDPLMDIAKTLSYSVRGDETKRAGLLAGYGPIDRPAWQDAVALYEFYGALELCCWWMQIGDHERAAGIAPVLERYAGG
jgi:aminoglycoside phosphotransferase (APT) family kinase protein